MPAVWLRLLAYLRPYWPTGSLVGVAILVETAFWALYPLGVRRLVDDAVAARDDRLGATLLLLFGGFLAATAATVGRDWLTASAAISLVGDLRRRLFQQLDRLPARHFARAQPVDLLARFSTDAVAIEGALTRVLPSTLYHALRFTASLVALFSLSWRLALVALVAGPLLALVPRWFGGRAARERDRRRQAEERVVAYAGEVAAGHAVVRSFGLGALTLRRFDEALARFRPAGVRAVLLDRLVATTASVGATFAQLGVICLGAVLVLRGDLSVGALLGFVAALLALGGSVEGLYIALPDWLRASGPLRRVDDMLGAPLDLAAPPDARDLTLPPAGEIRFEGVRFGYVSDQPILDGLDLTIPIGSHVALVGPSGSGKSTVLGLLVRFHDPDEGTVAVDGVDLRDVAPSALRAQTGLVFADTFLFAASIRENIRLGRPDADDDEVAAAARVAQLDESIAALPAGYDTEVGERGLRLPAAVRQRIGLARALLRQPPLLLLDGATASLDAQTEVSFNRMVAALAAGRTIVQATHRLAGAVSAGRIFVLAQGRVVESGTHAELLARGGEYRRLWEQQAGFRVSEDGRQAEVTARRLRGIALFSDVDEALLRSVADQFATEHVEPGQDVVAEGEPGDKFYILVRGTVEVLQGDEAVRTMDDGEFFGEIALLESVARTATVRARTPCVLLSLGREHFERLLEEEPDLRDQIERAAAERRWSSPAANLPAWSHQAVGRLVFARDGAPLHHITVELVDRELLRRQHALGRGETDADGRFEIHYEPPREHADRVPRLDLRVYEPQHEYTTDGDLIEREQLIYQVEHDGAVGGQRYDFGTIRIPYWEYRLFSPVPRAFVREGGELPQDFSRGRVIAADVQMAQLAVRKANHLLANKLNPEWPTLEQIQRDFPENLTRRLERESPGRSRSDEHLGERVLNGFHPLLLSRDRRHPDRLRIWWRWDASRMNGLYELPNVDAGFELRAGKLLPVEITLQFRAPDQLMPAAPAQQPVTYTSADGERWLQAKRVFRMVWAVTGEVDFHFVRTHLNAEQFAIAAWRNLRRNPVRHLLFPHLREAVAINAGADSLIIGPDGVMATASGLAYEGLMERITEQLGQHDWAEWRPRAPLSGDHTFALAGQLYWDLLTEHLERFFRAHAHRITGSWLEIHRFSRDLVAHSAPYRPPSSDEHDDWPDAAERSDPARAREEVDGIVRAMSPITKSDTPTPHDVENLKQACRFIIFQSTFAHSYSNSRQWDDGGEIVYLSLGLRNGAMAPEDNMSIAPRPVDASNQLFIGRYLSQVRYGTLLKNEDHDVLPGLVELLKAWKPRFDAIGYDVASIASRTNI